MTDINRIVILEEQSIKGGNSLDAVVYRRFATLVRHNMITQEEAEEKIQELIIKKQKTKKKKRKAIKRQKNTRKLKEVPSQKKRDKQKQKKKQKKHEDDLMREWYAKTGETDIF